MWFDLLVRVEESFATSILEPILAALFRIHCFYSLQSFIIVVCVKTSSKQVFCLGLAVELVGDLFWYEHRPVAFWGNQRPTLVQQNVISGFLVKLKLWHGLRLQ